MERGMVRGSILISDIPRMNFDQPGSFLTANYGLITQMRQTRGPVNAATLRSVKTKL